MKLERIGKGKSKSLYGSFLWMTLLPLCLCSIVMIAASAYTIRQSVCEQERSRYQSVAASVLAAYDSMYEGDYNITISGSKTTLWKGENILSNNYDYLDRVAKESGTQISFFFYDMRLLTTIKDDQGNRLTDTGVNEKILSEVFTSGRDAFYDNIRIGENDYFAYYTPLRAGDGTILGMVGVASLSNVVNRAVAKSVMVSVCIMVLAMLVTGFFILRFASSIVSVIKKMLAFVKNLAEDKLDSTLDESVSHRDDELGVMGRHLMGLQTSLRKLIERDALTGLFNRRSAERKIDEIDNNYMTYCVAIGDIDHFKIFNDSFGHECGDVVLKGVARILNESMAGGKGFVARWGGEEFLLVYGNSDIDSAYASLMGIRDTLHQTELEYEGQKHSVTMTFGVAEKKDDIPINMLIRLADEKLYNGKEGGRDRVIK